MRPSARRARATGAARGAGAASGMMARWMGIGALVLASLARAEETLIAIGDVHGDVEAFRRALELAGATEGGSWWRRARGGGADVARLVQTGDVVDRGDRSIEVVDALERLREEAAMVGDEVVTLMGNHELMTLQGDLRFVSPLELARVGRETLESSGTTDGERGATVGGRAYVHAGRLSWIKTFARGEVRGDILRSRSVAAIRGSGRCASAFVHAGLVPGHLFGTDSVDALNERAKVLFDADVVGANDALLGNDGPMWTRRISMGSEADACAAVEETLQRLGVRRMVVGHTPTQSGVIETRCGGLVHMIDVGMSSAYGGKPSAWTCTESEGPMAISSSGERTPLEP